MGFLGNWTKRRKTVASTVAIALIAGIPVTMAALHPGFPVTDVELNARDVWVTNGEQLLGGRLNRQIDELNGSVAASSPNFDVLQDGDALFMHDPDAGRVESVDASFTRVSSAIDVPKDADIDFGGGQLAITSASGDVWMISAAGDLQFNYTSTPPLLELGAGGQSVLTKTGTLVAVSPDDKKIYRYEIGSEEPVESAFPGVGDFQLTAVGEQAVILDQSTNELIKEDGTIFRLGDERAVRLQQVSDEVSYASAATANSLLKVDLASGSVENLDAGISGSGSATGVAAPVWLDGCLHGAWAAGQRYVLACDAQEPQGADIDQPTQGSRLEFRVNRSVIVLNNLDNGNVWLVDENMRLVENWDEVTPPEEQDGEQGDEKSTTQSFEETLAERTEQNRPPLARDDDFGVRPGKTTILPLLNNDSDPDGDVLVIAAHGAIAESTGVLDLIDGGRALQFTPAPGYVGTISFGYTIDDGRAAGRADGQVTVRVVPMDVNNPPVEVRTSGVTLEVNQTVSYNVLTDWIDPDGDDLFLLGAAPKSADLVQFTPDGFVTFSHQTSEVGAKEVVFQVTDGIGAPVQGTLNVDVQPTGALNPIGTPDFATTFVGETVVVKPLANDLSPSGAQLSLVAFEQPGGSASAWLNTDQGTITFLSPDPGVHYVKYTVAAGANSSVGIIRIDVHEKPGEELPPIAVKDTAYLRGEEPTTVSVLANDVSPSGRILAIQSVDVDPALLAKGLKVEVLESTLVRVTSPAALDGQVQFGYTVSDGLNTATAGVTVVPVPPLTKHQPPVAENDFAKVRVGDIITVHVLENDFHPDDVPMSVDPELITAPDAGIAFVNGDTVRFQAPTEPGQYRVDYRVLDPFGETSAATVTFTVTPLDEAGNQEPVPAPLVARVLEGGTITVDIPLDGIDPDGDSVQLLNFPTNPTLGSVIESSGRSFVYEAARGLYGTDSFTYEVYDAFGATGVGEIKIAVIPEPAVSQDPIAVPDNVSVRPGRLAQVDLMANDSDPQGAPIKVSDELIDVPEDVTASVVDSRYLLLEAPDAERSFSLRYELTNDRGGRNVSYVLVQVTPDAPLLPPTAQDYAIETKDIAGQKSIEINLFDGSVFNPGGRTEDLIVELEGPNAGSAKLLEQNGRIQVTPRPTRQAIAYRVTNDVDDLSAMAFILVPAAADEGFDDPPIIDPNLPEQILFMNETREWDLNDLVYAPSGRDVWIADPDSVSGVQSNGDPIFIDKDTLRFTPGLDYRGPAAINFTVTDGASKNDPKGNWATLRLPIIVGDPEFRDTPPTFTPPSPQLEMGESVTIDLRESTAHPNPTILGQVTYSEITGAGPQLTATLNGSQLTLTTPRNTPKGTTFELGVKLRWDKFEVPGQVHVTIVSSSRPLPVAVTDELETQRGDGPVTVQALGNDSNPYETTGEPLRIVAAQVQNTGEPAGVTFTGTSVTISPSVALKSGVIEVMYTVEDATQDPDRRANGIIRLVVSDVPDAPAPPSRDPDTNIGADRSATIRFVAPASNGKPISGYEVRSNPSVTTPTNCTAGAACTIGGLSNGTAYTFSVRAINEHGPGTWSAFSQPITPYGTPAQVQPSKSSQSKWAPANITWSWPLVAGTGGSTAYHWQVTRGGSVVGSGSGVDLSAATVTGQPAGSYTITVYAQNSGGKAGPSGTNSTTVNSQTVPGAPTNVRGNVTDSQAPGKISWSWGAPSNAGLGDGVTDNLEYRSRVNGGGWSGWGAATSRTSTNHGAGNHSIEVEARNSAGTGPSGSASAGPILDPPPPPTPKVNLSKGQQVTCGTSGSFGCFRYNVTLENFTNNNHTIDIWCQGAHTRTDTFSGNSFQSNYHCGYPDAHVFVDGVESNHVDFRP